MQTSSLKDLKAELDTDAKAEIYTASAKEEAGRKLMQQRN